MKRDPRCDILFEPIATGPVEVRPLLPGSAMLECAPSAGLGEIGPVNSEKFQTPTSAANKRRPAARHGAGSLGLAAASADYS